MTIRRSGEYVRAADMMRVLEALRDLMANQRTGWLECRNALLAIIEEIRPVAKPGKRTA
jgi:hypothetical protein